MPPARSSVARNARDGTASLYEETPPTRNSVTRQAKKGCEASASAAHL